MKNIKILLIITSKVDEIVIKS